jgi:hypothetical protein
VLACAEDVVFFLDVVLVDSVVDDARSLASGVRIELKQANISLVVNVLRFYAQRLFWNRYRGSGELVSRSL